MKRLLLALAAILASCGHRPPDLPRLDANLTAAHRIDVRPQGHGSGIVVHEDGYVLTAYHVVDGKDAVFITVAEDGKQPVDYPARVVAAAPITDLALLKIERRFGEVAVFDDPANVHPGDPIYMIGWPYDLGRQVQRGNVTALGVTDPKRGWKNAMMMDIQDGHGTSGAGIFSSASGKLVGIMKAMLWRERDEGPATVLRSAIFVEDVMKFLRSHGIRYRTFTPDEERRR